MKKKVHSITRKVSVPSGGTVRFLNSKDLQELTLRHQTLQSAMQSLQTATFVKVMVEEAYQSRLAKTLEEYGCKGKYDLDFRTGALTPRKEG